MVGFGNKFQRKFKFNIVASLMFYYSCKEEGKKWNASKRKKCQKKANVICESSLNIPPKMLDIWYEKVQTLGTYRGSPNYAKITNAVPCSWLQPSCQLKAKNCLGTIFDTFRVKNDFKKTLFISSGLLSAKILWCTRAKR